MSSPHAAVTVTLTRWGWGPRRSARPPGTHRATPVGSYDLDERLISGQRGHLSTFQLATALTADGHAAIGWPDAWRLQAGALADLVIVRLDTARTAGARSGDVLAHVVFTAAASDVVNVIVGGQTIVADRQHVHIADVGSALETAIQQSLSHPSD